MGEVRGRGLLVAVERVSDRADSAPFDPALGIAEAIRAVAQSMGLICYPSAGTVDGSMGDHVLLAPPYIASEREIDEAVELTCQAVGRVLSSVREMPSAGARN